VTPVRKFFHPKGAKAHTSSKIRHFYDLYYPGTTSWTNGGSNFDFGSSIPGFGGGLGRLIDFANRTGMSDAQLWALLGIARNSPPTTSTPPSKTNGTGGFNPTSTTPGGTNYSNPFANVGVITPLPPPTVAPPVVPPTVPPPAAILATGPGGSLQQTQDFGRGFWSGVGDSLNRVDDRVTDLATEVVHGAAFAVSGYAEGNGLYAGPQIVPGTLAQDVGLRIGHGAALAQSYIEMIGGTFLAAGGGTVEVVTLGGATPVAVPAILAGTTLAGHGVLVARNSMGHIKSDMARPLRSDMNGPAGPSSKAKLIDNPKHNQNSISPQPKNVKELYEKSIIDRLGRRWAKDKDGIIHRFSAPRNGETHWNGSTGGFDPIRANEIPNTILKQLQ
jgi:hypothetical protein